MDQNSSCVWSHIRMIGTKKKHKRALNLKFQNFNTIRKNIEIYGEILKNPLKKDEKNISEFEQTI